MAAKTVNSSEKVAKPIALHLVTTSHNPRKPLRKLQELGIDPMVFCHEFGLSDDPDKRAHFVATIREHHPEIEDKWESYKVHGQIQPIVLRSFRSEIRGTDGEYEERYGVACGERRYITCVFGQALTEETVPVLAICRKMTVQQAYWTGVTENLLREDMTELEKGQIFHQYSQQYTVLTDAGGEKQVVERTDDTQEPLPLTEVAKHFHVQYNIVRGRTALATTLPADRLSLYQEGKLGLTDAIKEALGEPSHKSKPPKDGRSNPLTMRQIQTLFDATDRSKTERLETLAEVMKLDLPTAIAESDARLQAMEEQEARAAEKAARRKGKEEPALP